MKIFISYPISVEELAEKVAAKLRSKGHTVFLDKNAQPVDRTYDERIAFAVISSDLFVFFITPVSVSEGTHTATELEYAKKRWPDPCGRVLPVMVESTDFEQIDSYLTESTTVLQTKGDFATEVVDAVEERLSPLHRSFCKGMVEKRWTVVASSIVVLSLFAVLYVESTTPKIGQTESAISTGTIGDSVESASAKRNPSIAIASMQGNTGRPSYSNVDWVQPIGAKASRPYITTSRKNDGTTQIRRDHPPNAQETDFGKRSGEPGQASAPVQKPGEPRLEIASKTCDSLCRFKGQCTETDDRYDKPCIATSAKDCQQSVSCMEEGNCGLDVKARLCRPITDEHCRNSTTCKSEGRCMFFGNKCVAEIP